MDRRHLVNPKSSATPVSGGGKAARAAYTPIPTVTANVRRSDGRLGVLSVEAGVDAYDPAVAPIVAQAAPRLRAAYAEVVQRIGAETLPGTAPDIERLVSEMQAATVRVVGRPGARFLIGTVLAL